MTGLDEAVEALRKAILIGGSLGLDTRKIQATIDNANERIGFTGDTYVAALVGGTGVGKSSLLNAIAGESVSPASVLRPTTERPKAWVASEARDEVGPLMNWLEIEEVHVHTNDDLGNVAIVDLPDFDSIATEHREIVDQLLPRIDVVMWVVDPEKYDDDRLFHYLLTHGKELPDVYMILNKIDQLDAQGRQAVANDMTERLRRAGLRSAKVRLVSATEGGGVDELRSWLAGRAEAKAAIAARIRAETTARLEELGAEAGVGVDGRYEPLLASETVEASAATATEAAVSLVDIDGFAAQVRNSFMEQARLRAGSLLSRLMSVLRYASGHRRRHAEPKAFLLNWRKRGDASRVVNPVRAAYLDATRKLSPHARASNLDRLDPGDVRTSVEGVIDRVVREVAGDLEKPHGWMLSLLSVLQWVATAGFLVSAAWYLIVIFGPDIPVGSLDVPYLGAVPTPLALGIASAAVSFLVGMTARVYASIVSSRQSRMLRRRLREDIASSIRDGAFGQLESMERDRRQLADLIRQHG